MHVHSPAGGAGGEGGRLQGSPWGRGTRAYYNCVAQSNAEGCQSQCLHTFPANLNKPGMFMQLAAKCIGYCVVCSGGGRSYYNCVAKPNDS